MNASKRRKTKLKFHAFLHCLHIFLSEKEFYIKKAILNFFAQGNKFQLKQEKKCLGSRAALQIKLYNIDIHFHIKKI